VIIEVQTVHSLRSQCVDVKHLAGRSRTFDIVVSDPQQKSPFEISILVDRTELCLSLRERKSMRNMTYMIHQPREVWTRDMNDPAGFLIASDMLCTYQAILVGHILYLLQVVTDSNRFFLLQAAILLLAAPLMSMQQLFLAGDGTTI
jgi:hypothetical protein